MTDTIDYLNTLESKAGELREAIFKLKETDENDSLVKQMQVTKIILAKYMLDWGFDLFNEQVVDGLEIYPTSTPYLPNLDWNIVNIEEIINTKTGGLIYKFTLPGILYRTSIRGAAPYNPFEEMTRDAIQTSGINIQHYDKSFVWFNHFMRSKNTPQGMYLQYDLDNIDTKVLIDMFVNNRVLISDNAAKISIFHNAQRLNSPHKSDEKTVVYIGDENDFIYLYNTLKHPEKQVDFGK